MLKPPISWSTILGRSFYLFPSMKLGCRIPKGQTDQRYWDPVARFAEEQKRWTSDTLGCGHVRCCLRERISSLLTRGLLLSKSKNSSVNNVESLYPCSQLATSLLTSSWFSGLLFRSFGRSFSKLLPRNSGYIWAQDFFLSSTCTSVQ